MLMVIFGAGASYDSSLRYSRPDEIKNLSRSVGGKSALDVIANRPPITTQLFGEGRFSEYIAGECVALFPQLQLAIEAGTPVEEALGIISEESTQFPHVTRQLLSLRHFIQRTIEITTNRWIGVTAGVTNYVTLLNEIEKWRYPRGEHVLLVTFNYDLLLDDALRKLSLLDLGDFRTYVDGGKYKVFKLHGSVNWLHKVAHPHRIDGLSQQPEWEDWWRTTNNSYYIYADESWSASESGNRPDIDLSDHCWYPAIAIPTPNKPHFECPSYHLECLRRELPSVDRVVTIGWRGREAHFLRLLRETVKGQMEIVPVVAGSADDVEEVRWQLIDGAGIIGLSGSPIAGGFSEAIRSRRVRDLFR